MKKPIALILSLLVLTPLLIAAEPTPSKPECENEYGIDCTRTYEGQEVFAMIDMVMEESDKAIDKAYAEGYKAGLTEEAPDAAYYRTQSEGLRAELNAERSRFRLPWWSIPIAFLGGGMAGTIAAGAR